MEDPAAATALFGAERVEGRSRTGYFIAAELVTASGIPLSELVRLSAPEGVELVRLALNH